MKLWPQHNSFKRVRGIFLRFPRLHLPRTWYGFSHLTRKSVSLPSKVFLFPKRSEKERTKNSTWSWDFEKHSSSHHTALLIRRRRRSSILCAPVFRKQPFLSHLSDERVMSSPNSTNSLLVAYLLTYFVFNLNSPSPSLSLTEVRKTHLSLTIEPIKTAKLHKPLFSSFLVIRHLPRAEKCILVMSKIAVDPSLLSIHPFARILVKWSPKQNPV